MRVRQHGLAAHLVRLEVGRLLPAHSLPSGFVRNASEKRIVATLVTSGAECLEQRLHRDGVGRPDSVLTRQEAKRTAGRAELLSSPFNYQDGVVDFLEKACGILKTPGFVLDHRAIKRL